MNRILFLGVIFLLPLLSLSQVQSLRIDKPNSLTVNGINLKGSTVDLPYGLPLFSVVIDSNFYTSFCSKPKFEKDEISLILSDTIKVIVRQVKKFSPGLKYIVRFENPGKGEHVVENLVPLGEGSDKVFITAGGTKEWPHYLCRSLLFRPGYGPVGVILPDNAWHMGFSDFFVNDSLSLVSIARRGERDKDKTSVDRWSVTLKPGGYAEYIIYADVHDGDWHEGLRKMFQERFLYDLTSFDNSMFERQDLQWMKHKYTMLLQFAWDRQYYDYKTKKYRFYTDFFAYDSLTGGFDIFTLWPTWPRLGLDQRNQWDMYRDLPGGLDELRKQAQYLQMKGRRYFISYNPWDESTRKEDQLKGMEDLLRAIKADGVVLDTRGASSKELQAAADKVKQGIIMYSEGMAIPKDMPGIVSGRVHDALVLPPPVNLNKFIKPDFAIFRVLQLADDRLRREISIAFFNGYGVEINTMRPGRPAWMAEEFAYLGRTTRILRENTSVFHNYDFQPLISTLTDSVYVNKWTNTEKTLFTIYSNKPAGFSGPLFEHYENTSSNHFVDLWNHQELTPQVKDKKLLVPVTMAPFDQSFLNTRQEGSVGCIAVFPSYLTVWLDPDTLHFKASRGDRIVITGENPSYSSERFTFSTIGNSIPYRNYFTQSCEKIVVQLFLNDELLDERIVIPIVNKPILISRLERTKTASIPSEGMVEIPAGEFRFSVKRDPSTLEPFIAFPDRPDTLVIQMPRFFMDKFPVTNQQFRIFLKKTLYIPRDTTNFLKHWINGDIPAGEENCPVVYINRDDAIAYARWTEKRLPTEAEWQYAAQGTDLRKFPWGNTMDSLRCNYRSNKPASVYDHPEGASPFGVEDMIGNVWQLTNDIYDNGSYYYEIIRGGSYYYLSSSIWYVTGGPLPADHPEMLLLISPGLDRNATVGFRCVKDAR